MAYAEKTSVSVEKSQQEIKKILAKYKATAFAMAESAGKAMVMFELEGRRIRFMLPLPHPPTSAYRSGKSVVAYEQLMRSRWRSLVFGIKAKLECVDSKITTLEQEFLAHIVLPNGATVGEVMAPQIEHAYQNNEMPPLLGMSP